MNCKPGDLAVIVRAITEPHLIGTVVRLTVMAPPPLGFWHYVEEPTLIDSRGNEIDALRDEFLCPIRDNDGEDEMLRIAGKPSDIKEPSHA